MLACMQAHLARCQPAGHLLTGLRLQAVHQCNKLDGGRVPPGRTVRCTGIRDLQSVLPSAHAQPWHSAQVTVSTSSSRCTACIGPCCFGACWSLLVARHSAQVNVSTSFASCTACIGPCCLGACWSLLVAEHSAQVHVSTSFSSCAACLGSRFSRDCLWHCCTVLPAS